MAMKHSRKILGGLGNQMFRFAYLYAQMNDGVIPDTYVQDVKYFKKYEKDIRAIFGIGITRRERVSLHVRRGDYVDNSFYTNLSATDYYERAIEQFPDEKFLVFCADRQPDVDDAKDMEWCKEHFQGERFEFFQGKDEVEDFNAQAGCKGHIIANSSFSFWCAYVGGGKTVAPSAWFTDGRQRVGLPDEWIVV